MAVRHADAFGGDTRKNQHDEDIQVGKRASEAAREEQPDKLRKTVRFEQEAPSAAASSDPTLALEYLASGETQDRPGPILVQKSGHVDDDVQISALEWYRGEDAGDLKRSELNELVENLTCLNALGDNLEK